MAHPLCALGNAVLEVIGLGPTGIDHASQALWPGQPVFGDRPFYQPTGLDEETITLRLAARPHVMGGLDQVDILKAHHKAQDVISFIRLRPGTIWPIGEVMGDVTIRSLKHSEEKLAFDGVGYRHEVEVELLVVGDAVTALNEVF